MELPGANARLEFNTLSPGVPSSSVQNGPCLRDTDSPVE
jgi:hypothetical protein